MEKDEKKEFDKLNKKIDYLTDKMVDKLDEIIREIKRGGRKWDEAKREHDEGLEGKPTEPQLPLQSINVTDRDKSNDW